MSSENPLAGIGELSKPATTFIEKIADAIQGAARPWQIRRTAQADADATIIQAKADIKITDLQRRAAERWFNEEAKKQANMDAIAERAIPLLADHSKPAEMEDDWITNFFDKCRLISDSEMQALWAKVLAGEANSPGAFSKRTVAVLNSLDKSDASLFQRFCSFTVSFGSLIPLIYEYENNIYNDAGVNFTSLTHLDTIGLISLNHLGYVRHKISQRFAAVYFGDPILMEFPRDSDNQLDTGKALLTDAGSQLANVCRAERNDAFLDYIIGKWAAFNISTSSPFPRAIIRQERGPSDDQNSGG